MRFALQPASGRNLGREYEERRTRARPLPELLSILGANPRLWVDSDSPWSTHPSEGWIWPIAPGPRNRAAFEAISPGDRIVFCAHGTCVRVHLVLGCAPLAEFTGEDARPALLLDPGVEASLPYSEVHAVLGAGSARGPSGLTVVSKEASARVRALLPPLPERAERRSADRAPELEAATAQPSENRDPESDGMDRWYRQGLVAHSDAFRAALAISESADPEILASIRRLAFSLSRRVRTRFPRLSRGAAAVAALDDQDLLDGARALLDSIQAEIGVDAPTPVLILVVEDEPTTALLTHKIISSANREFLFAATKAEAEVIIASERVDVVILDQSLPDADGRDLLAELRAHPRTMGIPVLVLSGKSGAQPKAECFALGADAYFEKPADPTALSAAVSAFLLRSAQIRDEVLRDPLTGLGTREVFLRTLSGAHVAAGRTGEKVSLIILDIDRFGAINDFQGREVGDQVLTGMAEALRESLRRSDMVARWGDDEFAIGLRGTGGASSRSALDKVRIALDAALAQMNSSALDGITFSAGVAELDMATSLEEAIQFAEVRLARASAAGGGQVVDDDHPILRGVQRVLLVEDDKITAQLIDQRLRRDGHEVVHFEDGLDALEAAPGADFDLVVLDVATPGADGFGLLQRLRRTATFSDVPIMMLTMEREAQVSKAFSLGATDTMRKPFALSEFSARVHRLLSR